MSVNFMEWRMVPRCHSLRYGKFATDLHHACTACLLIQLFLWNLRSEWSMIMSGTKTQLLPSACSDLFLANGKDTVSYNHNMCMVVHSLPPLRGKPCSSQPAPTTGQTLQFTASPHYGANLAVYKVATNLFIWHAKWVWE